MNLGSRQPEPRPIAAWPGARPIVWAPLARTVDVVVITPEGQTRLPLRLSGAHDPGYWGADRELEPGTTYGFSIDGGEPLTDPLATCLPDGLDDLSRVLDTVEPEGGWTDGGWQAPAIDHGVLLHLDVEHLTPEGTFAAAAALLPRIVAAGVHGVELAPMTTYDRGGSPAGGVRIFSVDARLGGPAGLAAFVDAAHAHGLAVVLTPAFRWSATARLGLEAFGPYTADGRLNLAGAGSCGPRDFLIANAEWWFEQYHVDGLALDVEALADDSPAPFISALADATVGFSMDLGRPLTLFIDGPGRSDRLTTTLQRLLTASGLVPDVLGELRHLARALTPSMRLPLRTDRFVGRAAQTTARAAALVVGDLTRLPGARRAMPWVPAGEEQHATDLDTRAATLTFAWLVGTPLVLDTDHVPVTDGSPEAQRLLAWNAALAALRPSTIAGVGRGIDVQAAGHAFAVRRGGYAIVVGWDSGESAVYLPHLLPRACGTWELLVAWAPGTVVDGDVLRFTGRTTAVLRASA